MVLCFLLEDFRLEDFRVAEEAALSFTTDACLLVLVVAFVVDSCLSLAFG